MLRRIAIVGASLAGLRAAETLRDRGFDGELTLIGDEPHRPYDRPPLSKQVLQGAWEPEQTFFRKKDGYDALALHASWRARGVGRPPRQTRRAGRGHERRLRPSDHRDRCAPPDHPGHGATDRPTRLTRSGRRHRVATGNDGCAPRRDHRRGIHRPRGRRLLPRARLARHRDRVASCPALTHPWADVRRDGRGHAP